MANPPFSYRWEPTEALGEDVRFKNHGLAPKSAADFAFLLHGFQYLKQDGVMAVILPHGVLFRDGAEARTFGLHPAVGGGGSQSTALPQCVFARPQTPLPPGICAPH